jgi:hypothetical protein
MELRKSMAPTVRPTTANMRSSGKYVFIER